MICIYDLDIHVLQICYQRFGCQKTFATYEAIWVISISEHATVSARGKFVEWFIQSISRNGYEKFIYILCNNIPRDRWENMRMHNIRRYSRHAIAFHAWSNEFVMRRAVTPCYRTTGHVTSAHWVIPRIRCYKRWALL